VETNADFRAISNENSEIHDGSKSYGYLLHPGADLAGYIIGLLATESALPESGKPS
jgi:hypothetical protein